MVWCWASVADGGPTLKQHCSSVLCLLDCRLKYCCPNVEFNLVRPHLVGWDDWFARMPFFPSASGQFHAWTNRYLSEPPLSADTRGWINVGLTLAQRRRRWTNVDPTMLQRLVYAGLSVPPYFPGRKYQPSRMTSRALTAHIRSQEKPALTFLGHVWVRRYHLSGPGLGQALSPLWARSGSGAVVLTAHFVSIRLGSGGELCLKIWQFQKRLSIFSKFVQKLPRFLTYIEKMAIK